MNEVLDQIVALLDGTEWDSDTCCQIAELLIEAGYVIRDPDDMPADDELISPEDAARSHGPHHPKARGAR